MEYHFLKGRRRCVKLLAWIQIGLQFLFPVITSFSASAATSKEASNEEIAPWTEPLGRFADTLSNGGMDGVESSAKNMAVGAAATSVEQWLSQFGTARIDLSVDDRGDWDQSAMDLLVPLYDNKRSVWFTQFGLRAPDGRVTGNIGTGVRDFSVENWMFGGNVFFDDDFTGKNRRVGFGAEAWTNYLKLSANSYIGTSKWHDSRELDGYDEKPADGFDIRAEGYLPAWPQLGAKLAFEQYYGDDVALFDTDHLQNDPSAVTVGLSYTPIPLISLSTNYRRGQQDMDDTQFQLSLRYQPGEDWRAQLDPDNVRAMRTLAGSRYDLVERNNQIVLQYKKQRVEGVNKLVMQTMADNAPADGLTKNTLQVLATDSDKAPVPNAPVTWAVTGSAQLDTTTSVTNSQGLATVNLANTVEEVVQVTAKSGGVTVTQPSRFVPVTVSHLTLALDKDGSAADGSTANSAITTVTDINDRPIPNTKVAWSVSSPATLKTAAAVTDDKGQARAEYVSTKAGPVTIKASAGELTAEQQGTFVSDAADARIASFTLLTNGSPANGATPDTALLTVTDANSNPISNAAVQVQADKATVSFMQMKAKGKTKGAANGHTDEKGELRVAFTDTAAENVTLTASLDNGDTKTAAAQFVADNASAALQDLTITRDNSVADGVASNRAEVSVKDANGNPVIGTAVSWSSDKGSVVFSADSVTDESGKAAVNYTDTVAESVQVKAQIANGSTLSAQSQFIGNAQTATLEDLRVTKDGSVANGSEANTAEVYVRDAKGNPLADQQVNWSADKPNIVLTPDAKTDSTGKAVVSYTSTTAETLQLKAQLSNGQSLTTPSLFIADAATGRIKSYDVSSGALANGVATNQASVIVTDANNNPLAKTFVSWSINGTAHLASESGETDADGKLSVTFTDLKAETVNVGVHLASGASETKPSTFVADSATAKISDLTVTSGAVADGVATNTGKVIIVDANNNPVSGMTVSWTATGSAKLSAAQSVTDADGAANVTVTDTKAEEITLSVAIDGDSQSKPMTFIPNAAKAAIQTLTLDVDGSKADGVEQNKATVMVKDDQGNPVPDLDVTWNTNRTTAHLTPSGKTDASGKASVAFTDTVAEEVTLKASLANGNNKSTLSQFIADSSTAMVADIVINPNNARADTVAQDVATATVTDAKGNILAGQKITWTASRNSVVMTPSGDTDTSGKAHVSMTDNSGGPVDVTATLENGNALTKQANFLSINVAGLNPDRWTQTANGSAPIIFTVTVKDSGGAIVKNADVTLSATGGTLSASSVKTDDTGQAVVNITDINTEDVTVTAKAAINPTDVGQSKTVSFVADAITQVVAGGHTFGANEGFPKIGFSTAEFQLLVADNAANDANYTWSTDHNEWIRVDPDGKVHMIAEPAQGANTATITATPTWGGKPLTYTVSLTHWIAGTNQSDKDPAKADAMCESKGKKVPSYKTLSNAEPGKGGMTRAVGSMWGEWGPMNAYSWAWASNYESDWAAETDPNGQRIYANWFNGYVYNDSTNGNIIDIVCDTAY